MFNHHSFVFFEDSVIKFPLEKLEKLRKVYFRILLKKYSLKFQDILKVKHLFTYCLRE